MTAGFQTRVNQQLPYAVAGDFGSQNPRFSVLTGNAGTLVASALAEPIVGNFAWLSDDLTQVLSRGAQAVAPAGFIHREQQGLITGYLQETTMRIRQGFPVTVMSGGDFWALNLGDAAVYNSAVYARYSDGAIFAGSVPAGTTGTGSVGATFTASGSGTTLTASAVTGYISPGDTLGTTTGIAAGTTIVAQLTGTAGGAGTYQTSVATTIAAATATAFGNVLNATAVVGTVPLGEGVTGTGIPANSVLTGQLTGATGGPGLYTLSNRATAYQASTALTFVGGILVPNWKCKSIAANGELVLISTTA